jgi:hypothetical protein
MLSSKPNAEAPSQARDEGPGEEGLRRTATEIPSFAPLARNARG